MESLFSSYILYTAVVGLVCYVMNKTIPFKNGHQIRLVSTILIGIQVAYVLFILDVPFWMSEIVPVLSFTVIYKAANIYDRKITMKQKECLVSISHGVLGMLYTTWYVLNGEISQFSYHLMIGYSQAYYLHDNIVYYKPDKLNSWTCHTFIMILHHTISSLAGSYTAGVLDEVGSQAYIDANVIIIFYALSELSNIPQWYGYYILNGHAKKSIPLFVKVAQIFMFVVLRSYLSYQAILLSSASLEIKIVIAMITAGSWNWGYKIYKSI